MFTGLITKMIQISSGSHTYECLGGRIGSIKTLLVGIASTFQELTQPTERAAGGLIMHDYTVGGNRQPDYLQFWKEIKRFWPDLAQGLLAEYRRRKGRIPYEQGYVYLLGAEGRSYYKIGKSITPDKRNMRISPQMPFRTEVIRIWPTNFMDMAEKWMHWKFDKFRMNGEWFDIPCTEIDLLLKGFSVEYRIGIKYAYALSIDLGLTESLLDGLSKNLSDVFGIPGTCIGRQAICTNSCAIAWLEDIFDQIAGDTKIDGGWT